MVGFRRGAVRSFNRAIGSGNAAELGFHARSVRISSGNNYVIIQPWGRVFPPNVSGVQWVLPLSTQTAYYDVMPFIPVGPPVSGPPQPATVDYHEDILPPNPGTPDDLSSVAPAPTNVKAIASDSSLVIEWTPVTSDPPVLGYHVRLNFADPPTSVDNTQTSATISGLVNNQAYAITVNTVNALGEGPSSGIIYSAPVANVPWSPIINAAQVTHANIAGTAPDQFPVGTSPVWTVGPGGGVWSSTVGVGTFLSAGPATFAVINPGGFSAGNRTLSATLQTDGTGVEYLYVIHDGVGNNWLGIVFDNVVGQGCVVVQQAIGAAVSTLGVFGDTYVADSYVVLIQAILANGYLNFNVSATNVTGTRQLSATNRTPIPVSPIVLGSTFFGIQQTVVGSAHATFFSEGFHVP